MPRSAWSDKREREYKKLKHKFEKNDRYKGREEEVAARIVNQQRRRQGETKGQKQQDRAGKSPDRNLPIADYQAKTVKQVTGRLGDLSERQVRQVREYEKRHKDRKTLLEAIDRRLD